MRNKTTRIALVGILALIALVGLLFTIQEDISRAYGEREYYPSTIRAVDEVAWSTSGAGIISNTMFYGPSGNGTEGQSILWWTEAELFATVDLSTTVAASQTFEITPQVSYDGVNWSDITYKIETYSNASGGVTQTLQTSTITRKLSFYADGTELLSFPLYGKYLRVKTTVITNTYTVSPTFYMILKNH